MTNTTTLNAKVFEVVVRREDGSLTTVWAGTSSKEAKAVRQARQDDDMWEESFVRVQK